MASPAIEQMRAQRRAEREAAGYTPPQPTAPATQVVPENQATRELAESSFGNRVANDVAGLAYGVPAAVATIATQSPWETAKMIGGGLIDTGRTMLGVTGILGKKTQSESLTYYKAHPVMALLDVASVLSLGAGTLLKTGVTSTAKSATVAATRTAAKEGVEASLIHTAFEVPRSVFNVNKYVRGSTRVNSTFMREIEKVVRTGDVAGVDETARALLVSKGVDATKAATIAQSVSKAVSDSIIKQSTRLKILDGFTHPVGATFRGTSKVARAVGEGIFGKSSDSAVGRFFEKPLLEANKKTSTKLEGWLGAVVDERGWEQTTDNRMRVLMEIKEQGDFQGLTNDQFMRDFDNYVNADISRAKLGIGNDYVIVKNLPEETANAMADTLKDNVGRISEEVMATAKEGAKDAATVAVRVFDEVSAFMEENFGSAWTKYEPTLRKSYGKTGNLNALEQAARNLSKQKPTLTMKKLSAEQLALVNDIEKLGYQVGYAPTKKVVSQAADLTDDIVGETAESAPRLIGDKAVKVGNQATGGYTWEAIQSTRNALGRFFDDWGFSARGTIEGASEFAFGRGFTQNLMGEFREKFGDRIVIKKPIVREGVSDAFTRVSIPIDRMYEWLKNHRTEIFNNRRVKEGGVAPLRIISVFDINKDDLVRIGFEPEVAKALEKISNKSLRQIPASVTGVGEKLVNVLRSADGGFAKFGRYYDNFLKTAFYSRYQSGLAVMFQAQQYIETKIMAAMMVKDARLLPGAQTVVGIGNWSANKLGRVLKNTKSWSKKMMIEPSLADLQITHDILLPNVRKSFQDTLGSVEFGALRRSAETAEDAIQQRITKRSVSKADVLSLDRLDGFWLKLWEGTALKHGARIGEATAQKFGLSLREATESVVVNGQTVYKYPRIVREMQDSVQAILHYKPGFQTSPLVKTLNLAFFPFRFQAKTLENTAKWVGSLDPMQRLVVVNQLSHFSTWASSEEGQDFIKSWRNQPYMKKAIYSLLAYTTAWEQIGDGVDAASRGQFLGGQAGLVGGIPLGFLFGTMRAVGLIAEDPNTVDPATGRPFKNREVPKDLLSDDTVREAFEEIIFTMLPGMPMYTLTGGVFKGFSYRAVAEDWLNQIYDFAGGVGEAMQGEDFERGMERSKRQRERDYQPIRPGETRFE
jgi:hypothetical protein